ncbi:hypothetical protein PIB30_055909 [Stylosanthes scabra]|uniref:DUF4283 domain-containing protein n=1 Tax=Stylosanthes scabra TaxID=79078 RepID=A0ABU6SJA5_9FABA|nr:hypothetical protein [Stylosanthes scabra]
MEIGTCLIVMMMMTLDATDVKENTEDSSKSLVGRIMADRSFSFGLIEGAFTAIWNYPKDLKIKPLGDNTYHFFFAKETDLLRVERGSPWLFKQYLLHVQRWNSNYELGALTFSIIPMWIQLWDMPESCKNKGSCNKN